MAEAEGYDVRFLGMRVSPSRLATEILRQKPALVAISYRLTPEAGSRLFEELKAMLPPEVRAATRFVFGGTPPVAEAAICSGLFERAFSGGEAGEQVRAYLRRSPQEGSSTIPSQTLTARVADSYP